MNNKRIRKVSIILLCCILFIYLTIGINSIMHKNKLGLFALKFYIMTSDSVESGIKSGDLVVAKNIDVEEIEENYNIIYQKDNEMFVKKIIKVDNEDGKVDLYVENDNVLSNEKVENTRIIGRVLFAISGLGNVALFIQSPLGTLNILAIIVCIFILIGKINKSSKDSIVTE